MAVYWPAKTPQAVVIYGGDWGPTLDKLGVLVASSDWVVISGDASLTNLGVANDGETTQVKVAGGTAGTVCKFRNTVTFDNNETFTEDFVLEILQ